MKGLSSVLLVATLVLATSGCLKNKTESSNEGTATADVIRVGEVGSMTGSEATFGTSTSKAIQLAFKQANDAGGIKGKKLELLSMDNQGKPEEAAMAVTNLITQKKVVAVLGEVASSRSIAMAPIAQQYKVPMVSPSSTNPRVTEIGDYIFRVCFIDPFQGFVMAKFAAENLKVKRVAILKDVKNDYSVGLAEVFTAEFKKMGGTIVNEKSYSAGDMDFKSQLTAIRGSNPEAIYVPGYYTEVGLIARQAQELGMKTPLLGGDGWDSPKLTEIGGKAIEGSYFSNHYSVEDSSPRVQKFIEDYKKAYDGEVPNGLAATGYDAALVLIDAMKRATDLSPTAIRDALATTKDFQAVTGIISIDEKRNAKKSAVVLSIVDGKQKYHTTINP
jgi:branched-chain amino acid transport system substrate-binding protein